MIDLIPRIILTACVAFLVAVSTVYAYRLAARTWAVLRGFFGGLRLAVFSVVAAFAVWAAQKRNVTFPRTDPTMAYLVDRDSYSTEDSVCVDFTRIIVPDSATWYLDYRLRESTNDEDWVTFQTGIFAERQPPFEFSCANATNYNWVFYTDWTPGPSVVTNGVWHAVWGRATNQVHILPLRTAVRVNGETIAPPKSRADNE